MDVGTRRILYDKLLELETGQQTAEHVLNYVISMIETAAGNQTTLSTKHAYTGAYLCNPDNNYEDIPAGIYQLEFEDQGLAAVYVTIGKYNNKDVWVMSPHWIVQSTILTAKYPVSLRSIANQIQSLTKVLNPLNHETNMAI